ncbi:MAG: polymer-forming cytoskeletal protein [Rickettsiales bacterium]
MFRRKEEGLFDADSDQNQIQDENMKNSQDEKESTTSSNFSSNSSTGGSSSGSSSTQQAAPQPTARPASPPPTASSFRPAASPAAPLASTSNNSKSDSAKSSSMLGAKSGGSKRVLTVGNDILLKGEIATCDRLVIEGKVDATLNDVHTVEIAECGSFKGAAQIEDAEISGLFEGELVVRGRLVIYSTGIVRGTISYGEIEIERGGELTGDIKMSGASGNSSSRSSSRSSKDDRVAA